MIKMNLDCGVPVEKKDNWGRTPLWGRLLDVIEPIA